METRDDETAEEAPPGWVLRTPTRLREVWTYPVLVLLLAGAHVAIAIAFGGAVALVVGVSAAVVTTVGAVALFVTGWRAYDAQTRDASWRCHVTRVVVAVTCSAVVGVASLTVGFPFGLLFGAVGIPQAFRFARAVPRIDHLVVAWTFVAVALVCAALAVVGLTVDPAPEYRSATWVGPGGFFALFTALAAVHQFREAARAPVD